MQVVKLKCVFVAFTVEKISIKIVVMSNILDLSPKRVFYYFNEICQIPHPSKKEAKMTEWLMETGKTLGLPTDRKSVV